MELRTKLKLDVSPNQINHDTRVVTIGSCFAYNMYRSLINDKFQVFHNPFGTLYNPISISQLITDCLSQKPLNDKLNLIRDERSVNYGFHSDFNGKDSDDLEDIHKSLSKNLELRLKDADWLIITLGTSYVYKLLSTHQVVANCHKQPSSMFYRQMLNINHIIDELASCIALLQEQNTKLKIICTVSPVRHTRDGLTENSLSKARLIHACHELVNRYEALEYFPSYEIMIDELRDYSYYDSDRIHPNQRAIDYIYDIFKARYFSTGTQGIVSDVKRIMRGLHHRPFNQYSQKHQSFLKALISSCLRVEKDHAIDLSKEITQLREQLYI